MPEVHIDVSEDSIADDDIRFDGAHLSDYCATVGGFRITLSDHQAEMLYRAMRPWFNAPACSARIVKKSGQVNTLLIVDSNRCPSAGRHEREGRPVCALHRRMYDRLGGAPDVWGWE